MKSSIQVILFCILSIGFYGCPYESTIPIDNPSIEIQEELLGSWENPKKGNNAVYVVGKHDKYRYRIEEVLNDTTRSSSRYIAHLSIINGISFLNLKTVSSFSEENSDTVPDKYYLYKIVYKGGLLTLSEISPNITEKFNSGSELRAFIGSNMKNSYFFNKEETLLINKYEIEKNEKQVILLNKDKIIRELQLRKSETINVIILSALVFVIHFSVLIWLFYYNKQKTYRLVLEKKQMIAKMHGEESERNRIANDLHDRLGSMLATVKLYFSSFEESLDQLREENRFQYYKATGLLDEACNEIRKISHELSPSKTIKHGIVSALTRLKELISKSNKLRMVVKTIGIDDSLDPDTGSELYRIILELTSNVIRHSQATSMSVFLEKISDQVYLLVEDNGIGFDTGDIKSDGMGLNNMKLRLLEKGGDMKLTSGQESGTSIEIYLPLPPLSE